MYAIKAVYLTNTKMFDGGIPLYKLGKLVQ